MAKIEEIQEALRNLGIDGWLLTDFHNRDALAYKVLGIDHTKFTSRRWFCLVPKEGKAVALVSKVEPKRLEGLDAEMKTYLSLDELKTLLKGLVSGKKVAMQFSVEIPAISVVDGGTVDLVRACGAEVVSSKDLVQMFEGLVDKAQYETHKKAGKKVEKIKDEAFSLISEALRGSKTITEYDVQQFIVKRFEEEGLTSDGDLPIVAINEHAADPHYFPTKDKASVIRQGDKVLIDLWARLSFGGAIYYDITWCGYCGDKAPEDYKRLFAIVALARDEVVSFIEDRVSKGDFPFGYECDEVARKVIERHGFGAHFVHRTGHSIGECVHGMGVNLDSLETKDTRKVIPKALFSIEPGIYLSGKMGVRTEINCYIHEDLKVEVTGTIQRSLLLL